MATAVDAGRVKPSGGPGITRVANRSEVRNVGSKWILAWISCCAIFLLSTGLRACNTKVYLGSIGVATNERYQDQQRDHQEGSQSIEPVLSNHTKSDTPPESKGDEVSEANGNNNKLELERDNDDAKEHLDRDFFFSNFKLAWNEMEDHPTADLIGQDAFSASWWQSTEQFLRYEQVEDRSPSAEGASFEVMDINEDYMRITRDWVDLNVEHMSKWWKGLLEEENNPDPKPTLERILQIFRDYIYSEDRRLMWSRLGSARDDDDHESPFLEIAQSTIAVIAYMPYGDYGGKELTLWSLAATMMSLVQLGVGRIVVSYDDELQGPTENRRIVQGAWREVVQASQNWTTTSTTSLQPQPQPQLQLQLQPNPTTFGFCGCGVSTDAWGENERNIPKAALRRLRYLMLNRTRPLATSRDRVEAIRGCWAGPRSKKSNSRGGSNNANDPMSGWKYVFLGEPDLILNTRLSALDKLGTALLHGGVLAPHRLQPITHASDFGVNGLDVGTLPFLVPDLPPHFDKIAEIDSYEDNGNNDSTACCDAGTAKPYRQFGECSGFWWDCAFLDLIAYGKKHGPQAIQAINQTFVLDLHKRLSVYPLARLKRGTGVVFAASESGRRCFPAAFGSCSS